MKRNIGTLLVTLALATSCGQKTLTKEVAAAQIISEYYTPPRFYDLQLSCADPSVAAKMKNVGLDKDGLVKIQETYRGREIGNKLVTFTPAATPYKLETSAALQALGIQIVKVADFKFGAVKEIRDQGNGQPIEVDYTQVNENVNGFAKLANYDFKEVKTKTARFTYDKENGYRIVPKGKRSF